MSILSADSLLCLQVDCRSEQAAARNAAGQAKCSCRFAYFHHARPMPLQAIRNRTDWLMAAGFDFLTTERFERTLESFFGCSCIPEMSCSSSSFTCVAGSHYSPSFLASACILQWVQRVHAPRRPPDARAHERTRRLREGEIQQVRFCVLLATARTLTCAALRIV